MAEKDKLDLGMMEPEAESPMKKMLLIIVGTILVTLILVFTSLYFLGIFPPKTETPPAAEESTEAGGEEDTGEEEGDHKKDKKKHKKGEKTEGEEAHAPTYEPLDPFTVTYRNNPEVRIIQVSITVMVSDAAIGEAIKKHKPMIRNNLLLLLASQDPLTLKSIEGKMALQVKIKAEIDAILKKQIKEKNAVDGVYFTNFIMQ